LLVPFLGAFLHRFAQSGILVIREQPFAHAFADEVRTALRIFKECREKHPELAGQFRQQAESALRFFSHTGKLK
jgi:hypothetical protein